ncbi:hypothetical protein FOS14_00635 [Skermania sp. ID1734]|nr:hypothetical protein FOS14_00635 [Skermania sp. ID1734]
MTDQHVATVLGRVVWVVDPVLDVVELADPLGLKARTKVARPPTSVVDRGLDGVAWVLNVLDFPGTKGWAELNVDQRARWWVRRAGALNTVLVAAPGVFGVLASRLPIQNVLGFANQAIVLCAVARERGVDDQDRQVQLLGYILCGRHLSPGGISHLPDDPQAPTGGSASWTPFAMVKGLWRTAKIIRGINDELDKRQHPNRFFQLIGMLPGVGVIGGYFGEYGALSRAAKAGEAWLADMELV